MEIWFWQLIISPHMSGLAKALSEQGHNVTFVAEKQMSSNRASQGWCVPDLGVTKLILVPTKEDAVRVAKSAPDCAIHICQGIRGNGVVGTAQQILKRLKRKQFVVMETVNDSGCKGIIKKVLYKIIFKHWESHLMGCLAIGSTTRDWIIARGFPEGKVFPFAYFLPIIENKREDSIKPIVDRYRILFVGQFIELKRLDLLILALSRFKKNNVQLVVVGSGPLETQLRKIAEDMLPGRVEWVGRLSLDGVREQMTTADCLVLPSQYDGWGAVVSEALLSGTPAICSDTCGSAGVVRASGFGGVFESGNADSLYIILERCIREGKLSAYQSNSLADWARCLGEEEGARYLARTLLAISNNKDVPPPPWGH